MWDAEQSLGAGGLGDVLAGGGMQPERALQSHALQPPRSTETEVQPDAVKSDDTDDSSSFNDHGDDGKHKSGQQNRIIISAKE